MRKKRIRAGYRVRTTYIPKRKDVSSLLLALLRTPKTKDGLIAATADKGVSATSVTAWLSRAETAGRVTQLPGGLFIVSGNETRATPAPSPYPAWLDPQPRFPEFDRRRVYRLGLLESVFDEQEQQEGKSSCTTRTPPPGY